MGLPVPGDLTLFKSDDKIWTTSLDVAARFGREHKLVLRSIRDLDCSDEFRRCNFVPSTYVNDQGRTQPCVRLTRDGFSFLAMGFTGAEAARVKEAFIEAFNRMEDQLRRVMDQDASYLSEVIVRQQTLSEQLASNYRVLDVKVDEIKQDFTGLNTRLSVVESKVTSISAAKARREITEPVKALHRQFWKMQGCRCPMCRRQVDAVEYDHFYTNQKPDFEHTWPLCKPCHADLTYGKTARNQATVAFQAYHDVCARTGPKQGRLL